MNEHDVPQLGSKQPAIGSDGETETGESIFQQFINSYSYITVCMYCVHECVCMSLCG